MSIAVMVLAALVRGGMALGRMAAMDREMTVLRAENVHDVLLLSEIRGAQPMINHYAALRASDPGKANIQATAASGTASAVQQLNATLDKYVNQPTPPEIQQAVTTCSEIKAPARAVF